MRRFNSALLVAAMASVSLAMNSFHVIERGPDPHLPDFAPARRREEDGGGGGGRRRSRHRKLKGYVKAVRQRGRRG